MSGQILQQVEKFVQCGVKVAKDETVMAVHMSFLGKPPKVPSEQRHDRALLHSFGVLDTNALRQLGWIQTSNRFKLSAS